MASMLTVKEYAEYVDADPRTVRRWMKNGLLKFTPPPKQHPHHARLIDSSQPRPKKKRKKKVAKSTDTAEQVIKPVAIVPRQADKRPPTVPRQVYKRPSFVSVFEPSETELPEPVEHESVLSEPDSGSSDGSDGWLSFEVDDELVWLGLIVAAVKFLPRILSGMR